MERIPELVGEPERQRALAWAHGLLWPSHGLDAQRYDIIALDDLRAAAEKGSAYAGTPGEVVPMRTRREHAE